jgi:nitrogen regulatory protein P-II 1
LGSQVAPKASSAPPSFWSMRRIGTLAVRRERESGGRGIALCVTRGRAVSPRGPVKKVEAIVHTSKLEEIRASLGRAGVEGMTITEVRGYGSERGHTELYRGAEHEVMLIARLKVEIVVEDGRAPALVEELVRVARTGRVGDGKIFVTPVEDAVRIRTSERGKDAL